MRVDKYADKYVLEWAGRRARSNISLPNGIRANKIEICWSNDVHWIGELDGATWRFGEAYRHG